MALRLAALAVATTLMACGSSVTVDGTAPQPTTEPTTQPPTQPPAEWQTLESGCGYTFRAPSDFVEVTVQGTDSCVSQYESSACVIFGDYGWYSDPLDWAAEEAEYDEQTITVDSRGAKLVTFRVPEPERPFWVALHVADVNGDSLGTKLTVAAQCADAAHRDEMVTGLQSLRFVP